MPIRESAPRRLTLSRKQRLQRTAEFQEVREKGERVAHGCLIANWLVRPESGPSRLGVVTSRKVGSATERSRARRLLRESYRIHQHDLPHPIWLVLVARPSIRGKKRQQVERDFLSALRKGKLLSSSGYKY